MLAWHSSSSPSAACDASALGKIKEKMAILQRLCSLNGLCRTHGITTIPWLELLAMAENNLKNTIFLKGSSAVVAFVGPCAWAVRRLIRELEKGKNSLCNIDKNVGKVQVSLTFKGKESHRKSS